MTLELSQAVISRRVFNQGVYDSHSKDMMLGQTAAYVRADKDVVDVGAAVGMYSHFWALRARHVYSFEAVPPVYGQLLKTAEKHSNMTAYNKAVGSFNGTADFWVDDKRLSNSSFRDLVGGQKITVDVVALDDLALSDDIGFMKIDVEGHELDVLHGAINIVEIQKPTIMCEIYPKFNNGPVRDTFEFFRDFGYTCKYNVRGRGLHDIDSVDHGVDVACDLDLISQHDGDFLFIHGD